MKKKTPAEMKRAKIAKTQRTLIRLKHSLAADEEINAVLPETLDAFDEALARGEFREITVSTDDVIGSDSEDD